MAKQIELNTIKLNGNISSFRIPVRLQINGHPRILQALLDTGAQLNFIDTKLVDELKLRMKPLERSLQVSNADGTENLNGQVTECVKLSILHPHNITQTFFCTSIP